MSVWRCFYESEHGAKVARHALHIAAHAAHITAHATANPSHLYVDRATLPTEWREGWHLSADNSRCDPPADSHLTETIVSRRASVVVWAQGCAAATALGVVDLYGNARPANSDNITNINRPSRHDLLLGLAYSTLAAAGNDDLLGNATVWAAIENNLRLTPADWFGRVNFRRWEDVFEPQLAPLNRLYHIGAWTSAAAGEILPVHLSAVTSRQLAQGKNWADSQLARSR